MGGCLIGWLTGRVPPMFYLGETGLYNKPCPEVGSLKFVLLMIENELKIGLFLKREPYY